jgi:anaerobic magnesium-protoporphyrin IX monomethyl ester cyclase
LAEEVENTMIVLINPPNPKGKTSNKDMMGGLGQTYKASDIKVPPMDLAIIAAILKRFEVPFLVHDYLVEDFREKKLAAEVEGVVKNGKDVVFLIRVSMPTFEHDCQFTGMLKKLFHWKTILYGPYLDFVHEEALRDEGVDGVILGEAESWFLRKAPELNFFSEENRDLKTGVKWVVNRERIVVNDLDEFPMPAWRLLPYTKYTVDILQLNDETSFLPIASSRGCPYACGYCPYPVIQGKRWRKRSPERVVEELRYVVNSLGVRNVVFRDPEFSLDRERVLRLCELIKEQRLEFWWRCETRVDTLDEECLRAMHGAGCRGLNIGIETMLEETAKEINRKFIPTVMIRNLVRVSKELGIQVFAFFIIGLPGQTKAEINSMIEFAESLDCSEVQFTMATPYPETSLLKWAKDRGYLVRENAARYTGYSPVMRNEHLSTVKLWLMFNYAQHKLNVKKIAASVGRGRRSLWQSLIFIAKKLVVVGEDLVIRGWIR